MKTHTIAVLALGSTVLAQTETIAPYPSGFSQPADVASENAAAQTNSAAVAALDGVFSNTGYQALATATLKGDALFSAYESAVKAAISAEPTSLQPLAFSLYSQFIAAASTDGLESQIETGISALIADETSQLAAQSEPIASVTTSVATPTIVAGGAGAIEISAALLAAGLLAGVPAL